MFNDRFSFFQVITALVMQVRFYFLCLYLHGFYLLACPVLIGNKWVANKWIHERGQEFRRPCSLDPMA
jgi:hypothetical protein